MTFENHCSTQLPEELTAGTAALGGSYTPERFAFAAFAAFAFKFIILVERMVRCA